jgi:hypothetical protein
VRLATCVQGIDVVTEADAPVNQCASEGRRVRAVPEMEVGRSVLLELAWIFFGGLGGGSCGSGSVRLGRGGARHSVALVMVTWGVRTPNLCRELDDTGFVLF